MCEAEATARVTAYCTCILPPPRMSPVPALTQRHTRLLYSLFSVVSQYVHHSLRNSRAPNGAAGMLLKRDSEFDPHKPADIAFAGA